MKRIFTIALSAILTIAVSAQDCEPRFDFQVEERTPVEKIWESIQTITGYRQDGKIKVNHGDGVVRYVQNGMEKNFSVPRTAKALLLLLII